MLLQRKVDRAMDWLKEKNKVNKTTDTIDTGKDYCENEELDYYDPKAEWLAEDNSNIQLEKGDIFAIIVSALVVFGPILLILMIILLVIM